jgi:hypothetical protein
VSASMSWVIDTENLCTLFLLGDDFAATVTAVMPACAAY